MKHAVLAILLTGVAGFIGLMGGVLVAEMISPVLLRPRTGSLGIVVTTPPWYATAVMIGLPFLGSVAGVIIGWVLIVRMKSPAYEARYCSTCGYDLNQLTSDRCPECGTVIPAWQRRGLKDTDQTHA